MLTLLIALLFFNCLYNYLPTLPYIGKKMNVPCISGDGSDKEEEALTRMLKAQLEDRKL